MKPEGGDRDSDKLAALKSNIDRNSEEQSLKVGKCDGQRCGTRPCVIWFVIDGNYSRHYFTVQISQ